MSFNALNFFFAQVDLAWLIVVPVLCIAAAGCGGLRDSCLIKK